MIRPAAIDQLDQLIRDAGYDVPEFPAPEARDYDQDMLQLGREELARMRELGLPVDLDQVEDDDLIALGESVRPRIMTEALDRLAEERSTARPEPEPDPIQVQELALVRRHNQIVADGHLAGADEHSNKPHWHPADLRYMGLNLDRKLGHQPILHLDPDLDLAQSNDLVRRRPSVTGNRQARHPRHSGTNPDNHGQGQHAARQVPKNRAGQSSRSGHGEIQDQDGERWRPV